MSSNLSEAQINERDNSLLLAKIMEQAERFDEMKDQMSIVAKMDQDLSIEERNLLSVAYKNAVGARRGSWRIISTIEQKHAETDSSKSPVIMSDYRKKIETELETICREILDLIDNHLVQKCGDNSESKVFYHKMKGDYYRYIAEFQPSDDSEDGEPTGCAASALESYKLSTEIASELPDVHPIKLGLALNFSVFYYEVLRKPDEACTMAKECFEAAIKNFDSSAGHKDSMLIMQLLKDNLALWASEKADEPEE